MGKSKSQFGKGRARNLSDRTYEKNKRSGDKRLRGADTSRKPKYAGKWQTD